jgi:hypothetical protein
VEYQELRSAGNTFVLRSALVLAIIHLLLFARLPQEQRSFNQTIGDEIRRVADQARLLDYDLARIQGPSRDIEGGPARVRRMPLPVPGFSAHDYIRLTSDPSYRVRADETSLYKARSYLLSAAEKNAEQFATLSKAKYRAQLRVPGTDSYVDEPQVRAIYPAGLSVVLLAIVLRFRNPLLRLAERNSVSDVPLWAAPIPYGRYRLSFWRCTFVNLGWFSVLGIIARLLQRAIVRPEFARTVPLLALNLVAVLFVASIYGVLFFRAVVGSKWATP